MVKKKTALTSACSLCVNLQNTFNIESVDDVSIAFKREGMIYNFKVKSSECNESFIADLMKCLLVSNCTEVELVRSENEKGVEGVISLLQTVVQGVEDRLSFHVNKRTKLQGIYLDLYNKLSNFIEDSYIDFVITYLTSNEAKHKEVFEAVSADDAFDLFRQKYSKYREGVDYTFVEAFAQGKVDIDYGPEPKMVWSDSLDKQVIAGFTLETDEVEEGIKHYTWNDDDCVYYWDESDEDSYMEVPRYAEVDY